MSLKGTENTSAEIVVPGSVANLGGGFDTLGVAVQIYLRARVLELDGAGGRLQSEPGAF